MGFPRPFFCRVIAVFAGSMRWLRRSPKLFKGRILPFHHTYPPWLTRGWAATFGLFEHDTYAHAVQPLCGAELSCFPKHYSALLSSVAVGLSTAVSFRIADTWQLVVSQLRSIICGLLHESPPAANR